jgi:hypothetical protein
MEEEDIIFQFLTAILLVALFAYYFVWDHKPAPHPHPEVGDGGEDAKPSGFNVSPTSEKTWDASVQRWRDLHGKFTTAPEDESSTLDKAKASQDDASMTETVKDEEAEEKPRMIFRINGRIDRRCKAFRDGYVQLKTDGGIDKRCKAVKDGYIKFEENGSVDQGCQAYQDALKRGDARNSGK